MQQRATSWLIRVGSFLLAAILLYLALKGVDLNEVWASLGHAKFTWIIPIVFFTLLSHWLRAVRWAIMLEVLPERGSSAQPISVWNTFISIMIGYMANYAGPRLGEVIRSGSVARREGLHFSSVLGTVVVSRTLDMATFGLAVLSVPLIFQSQFHILWDLLITPLENAVENTSTAALFVALTGVLLLGVALVIFLIRGVRSNGGRISAVAKDFREGLLSLLHTGRPGMIVSLTIGMWLCYGLMAYLPFLLLDQAHAYGIGPVGAWGIMLIGAIGVIIPSPGGIGTYHFVTIQSLILLFAMPQTEAATYALVTHTGQMILYLIVGLAGFLYLGATLPKDPAKRASRT